MVTLTETWLNSSVFDSELFDSRYIVYRRDRETSGFHNFKDGGGVLIAVSKRFPSKRLHEYESKCEDLWVQIECHNGLGKIDILNLCAVYLPPPVQRHILEEFIYNANLFMDHNNDNNTILMGDFNLGSIPWHSYATPDSPKTFTSGSIFSSLFIDFTSLNNLNQYNNIINNKNKILDLVLSNINISCLSISDPLSVIDPLHPPLQFNIFRNINKVLEPNINEHFCFHKADYSRIINELNMICWDSEF